MFTARGRGRGSGPPGRAGPGRGSWQPGGNNPGAQRRRD